MLRVIVTLFVLGLMACTGRVPNPCTECNGVCVDVKVDSANCGSCGTRCAAGSVCSAGACVADCPSSQRACDGGCFDLTVDPRHCGACGTECTGGYCSNGGCTSLCPSPQSACNGSCVDTRSDPANCGACGTSCDAGVCGQSTCRSTCPPPLSTCGASCVDTNNDSAHCGQCGMACGVGSFCLQGMCRPTCPSPLTTCGLACVDSRNDPDNCGACGNTCDGGVCGNSMCRTICALGTTNCSGSCVDVQNSPLHCGTCGTVCSSAPNATGECDAGTCTLTCASGTRDCDGVAANGCESDLNCVVPVTLLATGRLANEFPVPKAAESPLSLFDVSNDGQRVVFVSNSNGLVAADTNNRADVFVRDLTTGTTRGLTHTSNAFARPVNFEVVISGDGRTVAFQSAEDLAGRGSDGGVFVYAWNATTNTFTRLVDSNTHDEHDLALSDDGSLLAFVSSATNLGSVATQKNRLFRASGGGTALVFDPPTRVYDGGPGCTYNNIGSTKISGDGRFITFDTNHRLVPGDVNELFDVYRVPLDGGPPVPMTVQSDGGLSTNQVCGTAGGFAELNGDGSVVTFHGNEPLTGGGAGFSVYARGGSTFPLTVPAAFVYPSVDNAGLAFTWSNASNLTCERATTSGTVVTTAAPMGGCSRARIAGNGKAWVVLSRIALNPTLDTASGVFDGGFEYDLYLQFLP